LTWDERRYSAQTGLIGQDGQDKLLASRVLVIGAGGLGAPVIQYLAAAGVNLSIADGDRVETSNLNRQVLFTANDAKHGYYKAVAAHDAISGLEVHCQIIARHLTGPDLRHAIDRHQLVVAAVDNMKSRLEINDLCVHANVPVIHGGCSGLHGQVMVVPGAAEPCWRCMFPQEATEGTERAGLAKGILGSTCGIVGSIMAQEALKLLLGLDPLEERFFNIDCRNLKIDGIRLQADPECQGGVHAYARHQQVPE